ncbi:MAG: hypothetical protein AB8G15_02615 [Saprospiraceae bacterium]
MDNPLKLLLVVGIILSAAILFYVYKIYNEGYPKVNPSPPTVSVDKELEELLRAKEKAFFTKYANITAKDPKGNNIRTVTITQSVIQAISIQVLSGARPGSDPSPLGGRITINEQTPWQLQDGILQSAPTKGQQRQKSASLKAGYQTHNCSQAEIDFDLLVANDKAYEELVSTIIEPTTLGVACLCPSGEGWCNWSSEMFEQFMVDTDVWNLTSVEVFDILTGNLLSTSSINNTFSSPQNHKLVQMSNPNVLQTLSPGQKIVILFKWLDINTNEPTCVELFNEMP